jgi:hemoglobin
MTDPHPTSPNDPAPSALPPIGSDVDSVYRRVGPAPIARFAELLYEGIDRDVSIKAMFSADLGPKSDAVRDMREFLTQFFGGPAEYSERKGHPRLRARHLRFTITLESRDRWLGHAMAALDATVAEHRIDPRTASEMREYFVRASAFMVNS